MRAAVLDVPGEPLVVRDDVEIADPGAGQVRVKVAYCGVCHSDLSVAEGSFPAPLPVILGHEAAGVVDAVGSSVDQLEVGDHVVLTPCPPCGTCYWCIREEPSLCVSSIGIQTSAFPDGTTGLSRGGETVYRGMNVGAFAEYVVVPASGAIKIAADVPLDLACVIGCAVQTGVGAVLNTAAVEEGATVLVLGLGGVGLSVVQGAVLAAAARIIVSDPVAERRDAAIALGATDALDPGACDVVARTIELTGVGADYAFETAGAAGLAEVGFAAARNGGSVICVGAPPIDAAITVNPGVLLTATGKKLCGCMLGGCNSLREIPRLISLWQGGRLSLESLVTGRRPLAEINEAMADLKAARGIRTVLEV